MGLVDDEHAIVVRLVLKEPPQVGAGVEDVVVIADDDVCLHGGVQGQLKGTDAVPEGGLGTHRRADQRQFKERIHDAGALQLAGVIVGKLAHALVAIKHLVDATLGLGAQVHGGERGTVGGEPLQGAGGEELLGGLGGHEEHPQAVAQGVLQGRVEGRHRLADARGC